MRWSISLVSEDVLRQWREDEQEVFGENWPVVTQVLAALREYGMYVLDINPANIAFAERSG